jgi:hypothetical protein
VSPPGTAGYTLVSGVVTPGYKYSGYTRAPPVGRPGG